MTVPQELVSKELKPFAGFNYSTSLNTTAETDLNLKVSYAMTIDAKSNLLFLAQEDFILVFNLQTKQLKTKFKSPIKGTFYQLLFDGSDNSLIGVVDNYTIAKIESDGSCLVWKYVCRQGDRHFISLDPFDKTLHVLRKSGRPLDYQVLDLDSGKVKENKDGFVPEISSPSHLFVTTKDTLLLSHFGGTKFMTKKGKTLEDMPDLDLNGTVLLNVWANGDLIHLGSDLRTLKPNGTRVKKFTIEENGKDLFGSGKHVTKLFSCSFNDVSGELYVMCECKQGNTTFFDVIIFQ